jgi:hypothetical protein
MARERQGIGNRDALCETRQHVRVLLQPFAHYTYSAAHVLVGVLPTGSSMVLPPIECVAHA